MHSVGVPASDSQSRLLSHHSLDIAEVVQTAASAMALNGIVGYDWHWG